MQCSEVCLCCTAQLNTAVFVQYHTFLKSSEKLLVLKCIGCNKLQHAKMKNNSNDYDYLYIIGSACGWLPLVLHPGICCFGALKATATEHQLQSAWLIEHLMFFQAVCRMPIVCASADMQIPCPAMCITNDTQVGYQDTRCAMS